MMIFFTMMKKYLIEWKYIDDTNYITDIQDHAYDENLILRCKAFTLMKIHNGDENASV